MKLGISNRPKRKFKEIKRRNFGIEQGQEEEKAM